MRDHREGESTGTSASSSSSGEPGKRTLTQQLPAVQRKAREGAASAATPSTTTDVDPFDFSFPTAATVQRREADAGDAAGGAEAGARPNHTGMPDGLKAGIESLSGVSMDNVNVHYNSPQPAQLNALAYAQGTDIHLGPGQEQHLPHEAWHVVQQAQGRVAPTAQMKGTDVNDDHALEREADVMGEKAAQLGGQAREGRASAAPSSGSLVQLRPSGKVAQLVLATVNPQNGPIVLHQAGGGGGHVIMQNPTQVNGNDVSNAVGFTGVLNAADWANLGKSPRDYWRAHGYANSFGGAGDITNVGWWTADAEEKWTEYEQQVRGAGLDQIAAWKPGTGEQGTYNVDRQMHGNVTFKPRYVADLMKAVNWAFDDSRAAWVRTLATCDNLYGKAKEKRIALLKNEKTVVKAAANGRIQTWIDALFGVGGNSLEGNLIKKMTMTYTITTAGVGAGGSRANLTKSVTSPEPDPKKFGLEDKPEEIWTELVNHNVGNFAHGASPTNLMVGRVAYEGDDWKPAQELRAYTDGWGTAP